MNIFFWWSIVTTILSILFLIVSIWQYFEGLKQKERNTAQVKVWMQGANGVSLSLQRIVQDNLSKRYSSTNDVCNAVWAVHANAFSLYQSLYEERSITEKEYKEQQKELIAELRKKQSVTDKEIKNS